MVPVRARSRRGNRGFSLIELLIVVAIVLILVSIAVPNMAKIQMNGRETAAIESIQTIHKAQVSYYSQFGRFATSLTELGPAASGAAENEKASGLISSSDLTAGKKSGYLFKLQSTPQGYVVTAMPEAFGTTGRRTFYSDQSLIVRQNWGPEVATETSPELK